MTRHTGAFDQDAVTAVFERAELVPREWANEPHHSYSSHSHDYHKVLYCLRGSITFFIDDGEAIDLNPGDRLDIEPGTPHSAIAGDDGVACVEAAREQ